MTVVRGIVLGVVGVVTLAGCASTATSKVSTGLGDLSGRTFVTTSDSTGPGNPPLVKGTTLSLTFENGLVSAHAGCNSMNGAATWTNGTLVLQGNLASTELGCKQPMMAQDQRVNKLLSSKPTISLNGNSLTIKSADTVISMTDSAVINSDQPLVGTSWQLQSVVDKDSASSVPSAVNPVTLHLADSGQLEAQLGCNSGTGTFTTSDNTITFGPIASTKKVCDKQSMAVESDVTKVLQGTAVFSIDAHTLTLTNEGEGLVYHAT